MSVFFIKCIAQKNYTIKIVQQNINLIPKNTKSKTAAADRKTFVYLRVACHIMAPFIL